MSVIFALALYLAVIVPVATLVGHLISAGSDRED